MKEVQGLSWGILQEVRSSLDVGMSDIRIIWSVFVMFKYPDIR